MTEQIIPIAIHPYPIPEAILRALRAAKAKMDVDYKLLPQKPSGGVTGRILSLSGRPIWIRDYLSVDPSDLDDVQRGIKWAIDPWTVEEDSVGVADTLSEIFGAEVVEVGDYGEVSGAELQAE